MGDVEAFPGLTTQDVTPEAILDAAADEGVCPAIVVGLDLEGKLYVASSIGNSNEVLGLLTRAASWLSEQVNSN